MSDIETEHAGYAIRYDEHNDLWHCRSLDVQAKTLSALKTKIGAIDADARRVDNAPAIIAPRWGGSAPTACKIVMLDSGGADAWVVVEEQETYRGERRTVLKRQKAKIGDLIADTPENRVLLAEAHKAQNAASAARDAERAAWEAIPRMTHDQIAVRGVAAE